jgi:hypothetical protein
MNRVREAHSGAVEVAENSMISAVSCWDEIERQGSERYDLLAT